ncbi:MAG: helix-turn-helix domain-containing protein [Enterococcus sp.]
MENRIGELRREKGLTLKQMGELLNIRDNTLSQYETGKREPQLGTMIQISNFFKVSLEYLMKKSNRRDYEIKNNEDAIQLLEMIKSKMVHYYDLSLETSMELAVWCVDNQAYLKDESLELYQEAYHLIKYVESENKSLNWYLKTRKKENEEFNKIIDLLEQSFEGDFDGASIEEILQFLQESQRISYKGVKATLDFMKSQPDDNLED